MWLIEGEPKLTCLYIHVFAGMSARTKIYCANLGLFSGASPAFQTCVTYRKQEAGCTV